MRNGCNQYPRHGAIQAEADRQSIDRPAPGLPVITEAGIQPKMRRQPTVVCPMWRSPARPIQGEPPKDRQPSWTRSPVRFLPEILVCVVKEQ